MRLSKPRLLARAASLAVIAIGASVALASPGGAAQAPVGLGTAESFAVLAGAGITNANQTVIIGDVGTSPTPAETGFDGVSQTGTNHHGDAVTQQAKVDLVTAYDQAAGAGPAASVAVELGGTTLKPGVYRGETLEITGTLTLDTGGDPNAVFIFQTGSTLLTAANSSVVVLDGGTACNVFWQVPSSATLGTDSHLTGTVLASTAISANSGATIEGRLLAQTASVTLDHNRITVPTCSTTVTPDRSGTIPAATSDGGTTTPDVATTPADASSTTGGSATSATPDASTPAASTPPGTTSASPTPPGTTSASPTPAPDGPPAGPPAAPARPSAPPAMTTRPPLPYTGLDGRLPVIGLLLVGVGLLLLALVGLRSRPA
jgi:type VI secretion system secreted protein VgrG